MTTKILIDANIVISQYFKSDSNHKIANEISLHFAKQEKHLNQFLLSEILTVLLFKTKDKNLLKEIISLLTNKEQLFFLQPFSIQLQQKTINIFLNQSGKKLSFADCSIIAQARAQKIKTILTFDRDLRVEFKKEFEFLPKRIPRV